MRSRIHTGICKWSADGTSPSRGEELLRLGSKDNLLLSLTVTPFSKILSDALVYGVGRAFVLEYVGIVLDNRVAFDSERCAERIVKI